MNNFFVKQKYVLLSLLALGCTLVMLTKVLIPQGIHQIDKITTTVSLLNNSNKVLKGNLDPDSLLAEYQRITTEIETRVSTAVSASDILKTILKLAAQSEVQLQDLTTGEKMLKNPQVEFPVSFKANGSFKQMQNLITDLENSPLCIKITSLNMEAAASGSIITSVQMSVLAQAERGDE